MSINSVFISGNLTREPEIRYTSKSTPVLTISVAVSDRKKNEYGEWDDYTHYLGCKMFGNRAEKVGELLTKGTKVSIAGKLEYSTWEKEGQRRSKIEVVIDQIEIMSRPRVSSVDLDIPADDAPF